VLSAVSWRPLYLVGTGQERPVGIVWDTASNVVVLHKDKVQVQCEQKYLSLGVFEMLQVTVEILQEIVL
jgi:hypothetical protein